MSGHADYKVIMEKTPSDLAAKVNTLLHSGYELVGSARAVVFPSSQTPALLMQTLIKR